MKMPVLWKANIIVFLSSFCVMVIELTAARILAPSLGVSLYTWAAVIGVILAGIALGNYLGGKIADKWASRSLLVTVILAGALTTIAILPLSKTIPSLEWFNSLHVMLNYTLRVACIFFIPAIILSMVSPLVIKLSLADLNRTGGIVGTIYAWSTAGSILGTFLTGFYLILWLGTRTTVWLVAAALVLIAIASWFSYRIPHRWAISSHNIMAWSLLLVTIISASLLLVLPDYWQRNYTRETNYYTIDVLTVAWEGDATTKGKTVKILILDHLIHSYINPDDPKDLRYSYLEIFKWLTRYTVRDNTSPSILHLGGGGYSFPRYLEAIYPDSSNDVVEIDPMVTRVVHDELDLPKETSIRTYNQDARIYLTTHPVQGKYDIIIGDVFNDLTTPYHLTTLEFVKLVKESMAPDGIYLVNIIDSYSTGKYMPAFIYTLKHVFQHVYLFSHDENYKNEPRSTFVLVATDRHIDLDDFRNFTSLQGEYVHRMFFQDEQELAAYLAEKKPLLLTDDYAPTDILIAPVFRQRAERE